MNLSFVGGGGVVGISQGALIKGEQDGVVAKEVSECCLRVVRSAGLIAFDATDANGPTSTGKAARWWSPPVVKE